MRRINFWLTMAILGGLLICNPALALDNVQLTIINQSGYPDNQVYIVFMGLPGTDPTNWYHVSDWQNIAIKKIDPIDNTVHPTKDPLNGYANYSSTLDKLKKNTDGLPYFELPPCSNTSFKSARLWISFKQPPYFHVDSSTKYSQPDQSNPADPNYDAVFDFFEAAVRYESSKFYVNADTSNVDFVAMPFMFELYDGTDGSKTLLGKKGLNLTMKQLQAAYSANPLLRPLVTPMRVLAPHHGQGTDATKPLYFNPNYFNSYVDYCWQHWAGSNTLSFEYPLGTTWSGGVVGNVLTLTGPQTVSINKPPSKNVFGCDGDNIFNGTDEVDKAIKNNVASALNRTVFHLPPYPTSTKTKFPWGGYSPQGTETNKYYLQNGLTAANYKTNIYSQLLHNLSYDGYIYGFPYDDNNAQSSDMDFACTEVRLTIKNCRSTTAPLLNLLLD